MKAIEALNAGIVNLRLVDRSKSEPGAGEVLLKINAAALNYRDLHYVENGAPGAGAQGVYVPCSDGAGKVVAIGPGVTRVAVDDRVATLFYQGWIAGRKPPESVALGAPGPGTLQEYICLSEQGVAKIPEHLSDVEACTLTCAGLTAWNAMATVKGGDLVLVQGTGGVSIFALQLAKARGARVVLTSSSEEKLLRGRALGADHLLNYTETPQCAAAIMDITGGKGVDCVVEVGGAATIGPSIQVLAHGGTVSVVGILSGFPQQAPLLNLCAVRGHIVGIGVGNREEFEDMARAMVASNIRPIIDRTFALPESRAAFEYLKSARHFGKICILI